MRIDMYDPAMCCSTGCLPLGVVDGTIVFRGSHPARADLMRLLAIEEEVA
jgi:hypothetical protein